MKAKYGSSAGYPALRTLRPVRDKPNTELSRACHGMVSFRILPCSPESLVQSFIRAYSCSSHRPLMTSISRRRMLGLSAALLPIMACGSDRVVTEPGVPVSVPDDAVTVTSDAVLVRISRIAALSVADGAAVLLAVRLIVVRTGPESFRVLSAECPHAGCGVSIIDRPRLICPCHGSEFDFAGNRLAGPAPTGLRLRDASFDAATGILRVPAQSAA